MRIGIIGGSGLYDLEGLHQAEPREVRTPFGDPSDVIVAGRMGDREVFFLPRHGRGHRLLPSEINHRANIFAFKQLGVTSVLSISAVGSLREERRPRDIVLPDQYFDRTRRHRDDTFFGDGLVAHVPFGDPTCAELRSLAADSARRIVGGGPVRVHEGGTYVSMEGPAFSTKAEAQVYRTFGFDIIGMTSLPEAKLCREAEICYQALAMVTDYDCWHETEAAVTVETVIAHLQANTALAKEILRDLIPRLTERPDCPCRSALKNAILTRPDMVPDETRHKLEPLVGKYL